MQIMETVRKTITVTKLQNEWISSRVTSGNFTNYSEYIRDLIRRDQVQFNEIELIRSELIKGENSGEPQSFDGEQFNAEMIKKHVG